MALETILKLDLGTKHLSLIISHCAFLSVQIDLRAQFDLPSTEVYSFSIGQDIEESWHIYNPSRILGIDSEGYINQPHFHSSSSLYLTVERISGYTEVISADLVDKTWEFLTQNSFSEFSARSQLGNSWATVSVLLNESEEQSQELWLHGRIGSKRLFPELDNIGYYLALSGDIYVLFLVDEMNTLAIANKRTGRVNKFISNPGRCFEKISSSEFYFVQILEDDVAILKKYNAQTKSSKTITQLPAGVQDFIVLSDGSLLIHHSGGFHSYNPNSRIPQWKLVQNTIEYGIKKGTRLAYNGTDKLVLISPIE